MGEKCVDASFVPVCDPAFQVGRAGLSGWSGACPPPTLFWCSDGRHTRTRRLVLAICFLVILIFKSEIALAHWPFQE